MLATLLTEREAAVRLRLSPGTLRLMRYEKRGPKYAKLGGVIRYRSEDLTAWVEDNTKNNG